ncbi:MAG: aa3-type cytochrome c oxidase subunit IV [Pseudomonadota bacterium]
MADEKDTGQTEKVMDYAEHERTFDMFIQGSKLITMVTIALLIALAFGFFAGGGLLGGTAAFVVLCVVGYFFL